MYSSVNTRGLSDVALRAARREIGDAVTGLVTGQGIEASVSCDVPGGMVGPGVIVEGSHDATSLRALPADAAGEVTTSLPPLPELPAREEARIVWAHVDGPAWRACWPECQRVDVVWRDDLLAIPGAELAERVANRRAYEAALDDFARGLARLLAGHAASLWFSFEPEPQA